MLPTKAIYLIMKEGIPNSINEYKRNYETRLKVQKFIYLFCQIWEEDTYGFSWYLAGPYSSTLTHQVYDELLESLEKNQKKWDNLTLSIDAQEAIKRIHELVNCAKKVALPYDLPDSSAYELIASIWYIAKKRIAPEEIKKELLLHKSHFKGIENLLQIINTVIKEMSDEE